MERVARDMRFHGCHSATASDREPITAEASPPEAATEVIEGELQ